MRKSYLITIIQPDFQPLSRNTEIEPDYWLEHVEKFVENSQ